MADIPVTPKQGGSLTWIWMVIALALIAGLMIWLANQEGSTTMVAPVVEEDSAAVVAEDTLPADSLAGAAGDTGAAGADTAP